MRLTADSLSLDLQSLAQLYNAREGSTEDIVSLVLERITA